MAKDIKGEINKQDKYKAIWLSHSSMGDYEKCPRLYYLHNIYKDKTTNRKIGIVSPYMSLGIAVHNVVEALRVYKVDERKEKIANILSDFEIEWQKVTGKKGGFESDEQEAEFKARGIEMLGNVIKDPKMLLHKTIATSSYYDGDMLPNYYISPEENIILCGNVDWIEYLDETKSLRVVDFKTGRNEEKEESMQLFIYKLLIEKLGSKWPVTSGAYWYFDNGLVVEKNIIDDKKIDEITDKIIKTGIEIRDKRFEWSENANYGRGGWQEKKDFVQNFKCLSTSAPCAACAEYEKVFAKDPSAEYMGVDMYGKDSYFINRNK